MPDVLALTPGTAAASVQRRSLSATLVRVPVMSSSFTVRVYTTLVAVMERPDTHALPVCPVPVVATGEITRVTPMTFPGIAIVE